MTSQPLRLDQHGAPRVQFPHDELTAVLADRFRGSGQLCLALAAMVAARVASLAPPSGAELVVVDWSALRDGDTIAGVGLEVCISDGHAALWASLRPLAAAVHLGDGAAWLDELHDDPDWYDPDWHDPDQEAGPDGTTSALRPATRRAWRLPIHVDDLATSDISEYESWWEQAWTRLASVLVAWPRPGASLDASLKRSGAVSRDRRDEAAVPAESRPYLEQAWLPRRAARAVAAELVEVLSAQLPMLTDAVQLERTTRSEGSRVVVTVRWTDGPPLGSVAAAYRNRIRRPDWLAYSEYGAQTFAVGGRQVVIAREVDVRTVAALAVAAQRPLTRPLPDWWADGMLARLDSAQLDPAQPGCPFTSADLEAGQVLVRLVRSARGTGPGGYLSELDVAAAAANGLALVALGIAE